VAPAFSPAAVRGAPAATPGRLALGVRTVPVDGAVQSRFRLADPGGALVIGVVHDLPASRAGVPPGSVIVALNNVPVRSPQELTQAVGGGTPGVPVPIQYVLPGGESRRAEVVLVPLEASLERALAGPAVAADPAVGPSAAGPTPALARRTVAAPPPMQSPPQQVVVPASGAIEPTPMAPLDRLEALLRRVNERLDTLESRLDRIERRGR
jgi:membrane-associated protease RseP (regulator of RpoE activity)